MNCRAVGIAIDGHRLVAQFARGTDDAAGNLAPIGDQNFGKRHATAQAGLRFCRKAVVPSSPSLPCAALENTRAASCTRLSGATRRAFVISALVAAKAPGAQSKISASNS